MEAAQSAIRNARNRYLVEKAKLRHARSENSRLWNTCRRSKPNRSDSKQNARMPWSKPCCSNWARMSMPSSPHLLRQDFRKRQPSVRWTSKLKR